MNDCYDFAREYAKKFGKVFPELREIAEANYHSLCILSESQKRNGKWVQCEAHDGAMVLMGLSAKRMHHVGIYENGKVIHRLEGITRTQELSSLKSLYRAMEFYKWEA